MVAHSMARALGKRLEKEAGFLIAPLGSDRVVSNALEGPVHCSVHRACQQDLRGLARSCPTPEADALLQADNRSARRKFPTRPIGQEKDDIAAIPGKGCLHRWMQMKADCKDCLSSACAEARGQKAVLAAKVVARGGKKEPALINEAGRVLVSVVAGID